MRTQEYKSPKKAYSEALAQPWLHHIFSLEEKDIKEVFNVFKIGAGTRLALAK